MNKAKKAKKLNKKLDKQARKAEQQIFNGGLNEFANVSPLRGRAYVKRGVSYGW